LFEALRQSVNTAMYWQPPDDDDALLLDSGLAALLTPVAEALLVARTASWWATPMASNDQQWTQFLADDEEARLPILSGARERLRAWHKDQLSRNADFRSIRDGLHPQIPAGLENTSGIWWSSPTRWDVPVTTRELAGTGPVGLWLVEDFHSWTRAACWPVTAERPVRVYEINDPQSWADLVRRHPLDVTDSRQPDWKRTTGRVGSWLIPDWPSVATEFDAVHVTVYGYLTTAGRAVAVGDDSATLMAGWAPDETWWLTDVLRTDGEAVGWTATTGWPSGRWLRDDVRGQ
jgi:hypothetical protein